METVEAITARHPFLQNLSPFSLQILLQGAVVAEFEKDEFVFREGDYADKLYLIHRGKVGLECHTPERDLEIQTVGPGDVLGWSWLFSPFSTHFQARVLERTVALQLNGAHLLIASEENDKFGHDLMKRIVRVLIQRLRETRQRLVEANQKDDVELGTLI